MGEPPKVEVTIENLNDNVDKQFLHTMIAKHGTYEEMTIYYHPSKRKHLGLARIVFEEVRFQGFFWQSKTLISICRAGPIGKIMRRRVAWKVCDGEASPVLPRPDWRLLQKGVPGSHHRKEAGAPTPSSPAGTR